MTISYQILGDIGRDNAALVRLDSGQAIDRLLFDCGEMCLAQLGLGELQAIDHLLFSHLHMDHIAGFDSFFRATYNRIVKPNMIWGPPETGAIVQHRFQGYMWNLVGGHPAAWQVADVYPERVERARFRLAERFARAHRLPELPFDGLLIDTPAYTVAALHLDHRTPSLAYIVREKPRLHVNTARLAETGLRPGPWLQLLKAPRPDEPPTVEIDGAPRELAALRTALLTETPGESLAYLTDFLLDDAAMTRLVPALHGVTTLICESQYRHEDIELARRNYHVTATQAAELARQAEVGRLMLFHFSDRYQREGWQALLAEARAIFPETHVAPHWNLM